VDDKKDLTELLWLDASDEPGRLPNPPLPALLVWTESSLGERRQLPETLMGDLPWYPKLGEDWARMEESRAGRAEGWVGEG